MVTKNPQRGFTLIEIIIVIAIIGIIASIAIPSYQNYVIKTKRADAMVELHNIATQIENRKVVVGNYSTINASDLPNRLPTNGTKLYDIAIETRVAPATTYAVATGALTGEWRLLATPVVNGQMTDDGSLSLSYQGVKCRAVGSVSKCGKAEQWKD